MSASMRSAIRLRVEAFLQWAANGKTAGKMLLTAAHGPVTPDTAPNLSNYRGSQRVYMIDRITMGALDRLELYNPYGPSVVSTGSMQIYSLFGRGTEILEFQP